MKPSPVLGYLRAWAALFAVLIAILLLTTLLLKLAGVSLIPLD